jgi:hypothetical protein
MKMWAIHGIRLDMDFMLFRLYAPIIGWVFVHVQSIKKPLYLNMLDYISTCNSIAVCVLYKKGKSHFCTVLPIVFAYPMFGHACIRTCSSSMILWGTFEVHSHMCIVDNRYSTTFYRKVIYLFLFESGFCVLTWVRTHPLLNFYSRHINPFLVCFPSRAWDSGVQKWFQNFDLIFFSSKSTHK